MLDTLVDSKAYVSAITQNELARKKQQDSNNNFKLDNPLNFRMQVAIGQLEKPLATVKILFDFGDSTFAEQFVVKKNLTWPISHSV